MPSACTYLSLGTVSQLEQEVSTALIAPTADARAYVRQQATVNMDETSWRERRTKAWLWTAVTAGVANSNALILLIVQSFHLSF